jgi:patatin-related protein
VETREIEAHREVRFAVVLYGGVSLAIYIYGVVQELYHMVRATARKNENELLIDEGDLSGTERVYRRLGRILGSEVEEVTDEDPVHTRFIVDVLAGTSAGGINAVYLAKALSNGQPFQQLKQLWMDEADIRTLINDEEGANQSGLEVQKPPRSLLNSGLMYRKLLDALNDMDSVPEEGMSGGNLVDDLDLFVTITDVRGLPVPLKLYDKIASEKRHRNVLRFRYEVGDTDSSPNHFTQEHNPLLAFAARTTSAFPFAFEPMELVDIDEATGQDNLSIDAKWQGFFPDYREPADAGSEVATPEYYRRRHFVDGGYLDNRPFGHAIDALPSRHSGVHVDRKLMYIDPAPQDISEGGDAAESTRPNAVESTAAVVTLARYETIREDLERILERNRLIARVESIASDMHVERDIQNADYSENPPSGESFTERDLALMIRSEGIAYGAYHRLKIAALTDSIAGIVTRAASFDQNSDEFYAIRHFVRAWREQNYDAYLPENGGRPGRETQNTFLLRFDLDYRIRRLVFVLARLDLLYSLDSTARDILGIMGIPVPEGADEQAAFRDTLSLLRQELGKALATLRQTQAGLESRLLLGELPEKVEGVAAALKEVAGSELEDVAGEENGEPSARNLLHSILKVGPSEGARDKYAQQLVEDNLEMDRAFGKLADALQTCISRATFAAAETCEEVLGPYEEEPAETDFAAHAGRLVWEYYNHYDRYDFVSFPIIYGTEVGEELDTVEVFRVSPEDAKYLDGGRLGVDKLTGTALGHFGAFLQRNWRQNDILWGRLDGAERIINALLPNDEAPNGTRARLIKEAQMHILEDEVRLWEERAMPKDTEDLYEYFRASYKPDRRLDEDNGERVLSRSLRVMGEIFKGIGGEYQGKGRFGVVLAAYTGPPVMQALVELVRVRHRAKRWLAEAWNRRRHRVGGGDR